MNLRGNGAVPRSSARNTAWNRVETGWSTPRTPKEGLHELARFESELQDIRSKGVAVDSGGLGEGVISVAVAVKDYAGKVVGAITMLGPSFRMFAERLETEIIPSLVEGAEILSEKFGYIPA